MIDVEINASPIVDEEGKVKGASVVYRDVSERKHSERRQLMLMNELSHRGKNLFSVVQSIARLSLSKAVSVNSAQSALMGRLEALSRTYGKLTDVGFEGERLKHILGAELSAFEGRTHARGPEIILTAKASQTFALVIHELATNATKYGALSSPTGQVNLKWSITGPGDEPHVRFEWVESGGPKVTSPKRQGFGSKLIKSIVAADFSCDPKVSYDESGFRYGFEAPLSQMGKLAEVSPVRRKLQSSTLLTLYDHWAQQIDADGALPPYQNFDRNLFAASGAITLASIHSDGTVRFLEVGKALVERLGHPLELRRYLGRRRKQSRRSLPPLREDRPALLRTPPF